MSAITFSATPRVNISKSPAREVETKQKLDGSVAKDFSETRRHRKQKPDDSLQHEPDDRSRVSNIRKYGIPPERVEKSKESSLARIKRRAVDNCFTAHSRICCSLHFYVKLHVFALLRFT